MSRMGKTVLIQVDGISDMARTSNSIALWGEGSKKGQGPVPAFLSALALIPDTCLDTRHFSLSLYATGAFQAAIPVLELRGDESE